ncbi:MAG: tRNA (adenosine(37)-N6)-threonylcarbamoyltransferase complex ATPase subunit type 1 TsaE [Desulfobulbaceae bacterium]|nr:tRNA (adenosine(37)-N6)-threonylcarbamoyltransferase complex ATPase subunit type 1 TsaE [Desulfobulbaceae bacterium]
MPDPQSTQTIVLANLEETARFGEWLGSIAVEGDIFTLAGELGVGKTTLTQSIGLGLKVPAACYITSPTFSLLHEYPGRIPLYHMDLYRLSCDEIIELGFEDYLYGEGLSVVEWPDRLEEIMPHDRLQIEISMTSETSRTAHLSWHGRMRTRSKDFPPKSSA